MSRQTMYKRKHFCIFVIWDRINLKGNKEKSEDFLKPNFLLLIHFNQWISFEVFNYIKYLRFGIRVLIDFNQYSSPMYLCTCSHVFHEKCFVKRKKIASNFENVVFLSDNRNGFLSSFNSTNFIFSSTAIYSMVCKYITYRQERLCVRVTTIICKNRINSKNSMHLVKKKTKVQCYFLANYVCRICLTRITIEHPFTSKYIS